MEENEGMVDQGFWPGKPMWVVVKSMTIFAVAWAIFACIHWAIPGRQMALGAWFVGLFSGSLIPQGDAREKGPVRRALAAYSLAMGGMGAVAFALGALYDWSVKREMIGSLWIAMCCGLACGAIHGAVLAAGVCVARRAGPEGN